MFRTLTVLYAALVLSSPAGAQFKLGGDPPRDKPTGFPDTPAAAGSPSDAPADPTFVLPEFPPGLFTDGGDYRLNDLRGKTIVLFFFDPTDERALATMAQRNAVVRNFRDKPVAFFGVVADTIDGARRAADATGLRMPIFADTLGVLAARYRATLTPRQTWHVVIIDGDGQQSAGELTASAVLATVPSARWSYRELPHDPRLQGAVDALEAGDFEGGARTMNAMIAGVDRKLADAARDFRHQLRNEAAKWVARAERVEATSPVEAYDLYARVALFFGGTEFFRPAAEAAKRLEAVRAVKDELTARRMYDVLSAAVSRNQSIQKWDAAGYCEEIIRACPGTPTADRLVRYLDDLGKARGTGRVGPIRPTTGRRGNAH
jgi:peroxiredoxin Q/BCP